MEYAEGTLDSELKKQISEPKKIQYSLDIVQGIYALHELQLMHCDLKNANIFLVQEYTGTVAKIADFDSAQLRTSNVEFQINVRPGIWSAPEMFERRQGTDKIDSYSFGLILYSIHSGNVAFKEYEETYTTLENIKIQGEVTFLENFPCTGIYAAELKKIIKECLQGDPQDRPSFKTLEIKLKKLFQTFKST